jgi:hypothetical protein
LIPNNNNQVQPQAAVDGARNGDNNNNDEENQQQQQQERNNFHDQHQQNPSLCLQLQVNNPPHIITQDVLHNVFDVVAPFNRAIQLIPREGGNVYKALLYFSTVAEAQIAMETLNGVALFDAEGGTMELQYVQDNNQNQNDDHDDDAANNNDNINQYEAHHRNIAAGMMM